MAISYLMQIAQGFAPMGQISWAQLVQF